ncbi:MAG: UDP-N-acetylglucosamine--N-acetylmuramyl-(pentapeptide) pyrophosphoryl-undecaprenol N-acetylglucosamine transferase [bacterium]
MTIVITGAGSGGHVTPLLAVATELKKIDPKINVVFMGQKGDPFGQRLEKSDILDQSIYISAGKFRRYHGAGLSQLLDFPTIFKNIIDFFKFIIGTIQAFFILFRIKPSIVFIKGGYIGVPVGLAAAVLGIKYITHDSDTMPGLANRIIARWALNHATGMPKELYSYPQDKTIYVGVPISDQYKKVSDSHMSEYKESLGIDKKNQVILFAGGGLGSITLNEALLSIVESILEENPNVVLVNIAGKDHETEYNKKYDKKISAQMRKRVIVKGFVSDLYRYSGASDLIISRAGATNLAEFATQAKACIIIPSPYLTGGHQVKNAKALEGSGAVEMLDEDVVTSNPSVLLDKINILVNSKQRRQELAENLNSFTKEDASLNLAQLLIDKS